ncbi:MAG: glycosyltransferase family 2 protein [Bacteroidales bacterium]|nr:glycosyltransferase family 2 protein [Bacteroidales bacterium]
MILIDWILFTIFAVNTAYLFFFSCCSLLKKKKTKHASSGHKQIVLLIPAYKEDEVIEESVESCLEQDYPKDRYSIVVVSDHMQKATNDRLSAKAVKLLIADFKISTKAKALNLGMEHCAESDLVLILDADNTIEPDFLSRINEFFTEETVKIAQSHRIAKNIETEMSFLDAVSEEINNSIFRLGHSNVGLSASLIGSGMVFDYSLFRQEMHKIHAIGGFDRHLMLALIKDRHRIHYIPNACVYDEKVQNMNAFSNQRRRWLSAQLHYVGMYMKDFPKALLGGNIDFCNSYFQQLLFPRVIMLGYSYLFTLLLTFFVPSMAVKWWIMSIVLTFSIAIAIPSRFYSGKMIKALAFLPKGFYLMTLNFFKLKGANKSFIHTPHGKQQQDK